MPDTETREKVGRWELGFLQELGPFRGCTAEKGWNHTRGAWGAGRRCNPIGVHSREGLGFCKGVHGEQGRDEILQGIHRGTGQGLQVDLQSRGEGIGQMPGWI